jgi:N-acyl-D-aspartate/D-glutamate deacylase
LSDSVERPQFDSGYFADQLLGGWDVQFPVTADMDYEPTWESSVAGLAAGERRDPAAVAYDVLMANEGTGLLRLAHSNYANGSLEPVRRMLEHPATLISLSDAGAHATTCHDFSCPTFLLTHWVRDRKRGSGTVPIETAVKWQTMDTAKAYGLHDRGRLASGFLADINVIDLQKLALGMPYLANDLPGGCMRMLQRAVGYTATLKSGVVTYRNGEATGARPGGVIRGPQRKRASNAA